MPTRTNLCCADCSDESLIHTAVLAATRRLISNLRLRSLLVRALDVRALLGCSCGLLRHDTCNDVGRLAGVRGQGVCSVVVLPSMVRMLMDVKQDILEGLMICATCMLCV